MRGHGWLARLAERRQRAAQFGCAHRPQPRQQFGLRVRTGFKVQCGIISEDGRQVGGDKGGPAFRSRRKGRASGRLGFNVPGDRPDAQPLRAHAVQVTAPQLIQQLDRFGAGQWLGERKPEFKRIASVDGNGWFGPAPFGLHAAPQRRKRGPVGGAVEGATTMVRTNVGDGGLAWLSPGPVPAPADRGNSR